MPALTLRPGEWIGWQDIPGRHAGWPPGPVFVTALAPLRSGRRLLDLHVIRPFRPVVAIRDSVRLQVMQRGPGLILGSTTDEAGTVRLVVITPLTFDWFREHCSLLTDRFPPSRFTADEDGAPVTTMTGPAYARCLFGREETAMLDGVTEESLPGPKPPMAASQARFRLDHTYDPFDSWLIWRGTAPRAMRDKWLICARDGHLLFRRRAGGHLIYAVEATWRGDRLHLGTVTASRDPRAWAVTDDRHDRDLVVHLINLLLIGVPESAPGAPR